MNKNIIRKPFLAIKPLTVKLYYYGIHLVGQVFIGQRGRLNIAHQGSSFHAGAKIGHIRGLECILLVLKVQGKSLTLTIGGFIVGLSSDLDLLRFLFAISQ